MEIPEKLCAANHTGPCLDSDPYLTKVPDVPFWMGLLNPIIEFFQSIFV